MADAVRWFHAEDQQIKKSRLVCGCAGVTPTTTDRNKLLRPNAVGFEVVGCPLRARTELDEIVFADEEDRIHAQRIIACDL